MALQACWTANAGNSKGIFSRSCWDTSVQSCVLLFRMFCMCDSWCVCKSCVYLHAICSALLSFDIKKKTVERASSAPVAPASKIPAVHPCIRQTHRLLSHISFLEIFATLHLYKILSLPKWVKRGGREIREKVQSFELWKKRMFSMHLIIDAFNQHATEVCMRATQSRSCKQVPYLKVAEEEIHSTFAILSIENCCRAMCSVVWCSLFCFLVLFRQARMCWCKRWNFTEASQPFCVNFFAGGAERRHQQLLRPQTSCRCSHRGRRQGSHTR